MSGYRYDVFFSYKRDPESNDWHQRVRDKLVFWLKKELATRDLAVFFDQETIETGDRWKEKIWSALRGAKCLVCMWSPDYFQSQWCFSEWQSFVERENQLKLRTGGLIVPANIHDGESFPESANDYQQEDFNNYFATMPYFWDSKDAYDFEQKKLKQFAKRVATLIDKAPQFREDFPCKIVPQDEIPHRKVIGRVADQ